MNAGFIDRQRAALLLQAAGLDALVVCEPEAFQYVTGYSQGVAGLFRRAGAGFALVPADPALPIGVVVGDLFAEPLLQSDTGLVVRTHPLWIETAQLAPSLLPIEERLVASWSTRADGFARPATFDLKSVLQALKGLLQWQGLLDARLGFDLDFVPGTDFFQIRAALAKAVIFNGSPVLNRLRMIKAPREIEWLRRGASLAEAGLRELAGAVRAGQSVQELSEIFRSGVAAAARCASVAPPPSWEYISVGTAPWSKDVRVTPGAVIKADVGCVIQGYSSDSSRNFIFGAADAGQRRLHEILESAFAAGRAAIGPGKPLAGVHQAVTRHIHEAGLRGFTRGHFGHSLGSGPFCEQWPFISADSELCFEPGMVMAFEVPIYVDGVGGFNIEDQILVTESGAESMNVLPHHLLTVPVPPGWSPGVPAPENSAVS